MLYKMADKLKKRRPETLGFEISDDDLKVIVALKIGAEIDDSEYDLSSFIDGGFVVSTQEIDNSPTSADTITEEDNDASTD